MDKIFYWGRIKAFLEVNGESDLNAITEYVRKDINCVISEATIRNVLNHYKLLNKIEVRPKETRTRALLFNLKNNYKP